MTTLYQLLPNEERKAVERCLAGGDSPCRELVCQLIDRLKMVADTRDITVKSKSASYLEACIAYELSNVRLEAYRYALMVACKLQNDADNDAFVKAVNEPPLLPHQSRAMAKGKAL